MGGRRCGWHRVATSPLPSINYSNFCESKWNIQWLHASIFSLSSIEQNLPLNAPSLKGSPSKITNNIEPKRRLLEEKKMLVVSSLQTKAPSRDQTVRSASDMPENRLDNPIAEVIRDKDLHVGTQRGFPTEKTKRIETTHWLDQVWKKIHWESWFDIPWIQESKRREIESRLQWTEEILGEIVGENQELRQRMLEVPVRRFFSLKSKKFLLYRF